MVAHPVNLGLLLRLHTYIQFYIHLPTPFNYNLAIRNGELLVELLVKLLESYTTML